MADYKDEDTLRRLYSAEGMTLVAIAERFDCSRSTIRRWLDKHGIPVRPHYGVGEKPYHDEDTLRELYWGENMTTVEIGHKFGCSGQTIHKWMGKCNIPTRKGGEPTEKKPWHDEERLRRMYCDGRMSQHDIAVELGCCQSTVGDWLKKFGIESRGRGETNIKPYAGYRMESDGHMEWYSYSQGEQFFAKVHRVLAVSEYGFDALDGKVVHHKNEIPWDNRPGNIEIMTQSEHASFHFSEDGASGEGGAC